jgi:glycosyltransferase involved in cell wall biosynthesis
VADNQAIAEYVEAMYGKRCEVITYGGDHVLQVPARVPCGVSLPDRFALALSRIEPENNVEMILQAFARQASIPLIYVGNWEGSAFGKSLKERYSALQNIVLLDPIYDLGILRFIRERASVYVHGHSAGGTNPSLVETMHFGCPVIAFDCTFNRFTTDNQALFFRDRDSLQGILRNFRKEDFLDVGERMRTLATTRYTWDQISRRYFFLFA